VKDVIFDISHFQGIVDFNAARGAGMEAVILKASQGLTMADPMFRINSGKAIEAGLLIGAYHFGTDFDGTKQADNFLSLLPEEPLVRVLDFEQNPSQMMIDQAVAFVERVQERTGKWPVIYTDRIHAQVLATSQTIVQNCPLWYASYRDLSSPPAPPLGWTQGYVLWQYTQTGRVAGVGGACDRDAFVGDDLQQWWFQNS